MSDDIERTDAGTPMLNFPSMQAGDPKPIKKEGPAENPPQETGPMLSFPKSELQMEDIRLRNEAQAEKERKIRDDYFHEQQNILEHGPLDKLNEEVLSEEEQEISELAEKGNYNAIEQQISQELTALNADPRATEFLSLCREMGGSGDPEINAILRELSSWGIRLVKVGKKKGYRGLP